MKEHEEIARLCNGTSGNPPPTASWSKDRNVIDGVGYLKKTLLLRRVSHEDAGIYKCTVKSHNLTDEKTIEVKVKCKYNVDLLLNQKFLYFLNDLNLEASLDICRG